MFDYHNPHTSAIECCIRQPVGSVKIMAGEIVPTPEMEARGITADVLFPFVLPSFLRPTPPVIRRRLLAEAGASIPKDLVTATAHLPEFGGKFEPVPTPTVTEKRIPTQVKLRRQTRHSFCNELESALKTKRVAPSIQRNENDLQQKVDASCSSRSMRPVDPDAEVKPW